MNRINPALFSAAFTAWVRETWPDRPNLMVIHDKTSRRSHDRADDKGHGAKNMAIARHFAINLVRAAKDKHSIKLRRKAAGWDPAYLAAMLGALPR